ncbi:MAG: molybdenum-dependent transcriptional regulator [Candidatus Jordarchaeales archaeon]
MSVKLKVKVWLEYRGESVIGRGGAELLKGINEKGSLSSAARRLGVSYKYAWKYLRRIESKLGIRIVVSTRGGREKGGTRLTEEGKRLLSKYMRFSRFIDNVLKNPEMWEACGLSIPDKNVLHGRVKLVGINGSTAVVKVEVNRPTEIVAAISSMSAEELNLKPGDEVKLLVKATEVAINKEEPL